MISLSVDCSPQVVALIAHKLKEENRWTAEKIKALKKLIAKQLGAEEIASVLELPVADV